MKPALKILAAGLLLCGATILSVDAVHSLPAKDAGPGVSPLPPQTAPVAAVTPYVAAQQRWQTVVSLFNQLPADVHKKIGTENAARIYPLSVRRPAY